MGVIAEAMRIHPTPHIPKKDSGAYITGREVGWCDHGLLGMGELDGTRGRDGVEGKITGQELNRKDHLV